MIRPLELHIERFGSFVEKQVFRFPEKAGLYYLGGVNKAEPDLEGNGTGKTTIWRALTWCVFGKDARNLKAGDVANWSAPKDAFVGFAFEVEDAGTWMGYSIERTHAPNSWKLIDAFGTAVDLTKEEQNPLYSMLKLEFDMWLNCVLMSQGQPMFLDMKAEAKAELFSAVMGLDEWLVRSDRADKLAKVEDLKVRDLERDIASIDGKLESINSMAVNNDAAIQGWESAQKVKLRELEDRYNVLVDEAATLGTNADFASSALPGADKDLLAATELADNLTVQYREKTDAYVVDRDRHNDALNDEKHAKARYDAALAAVKAGKCPTCGGRGHLGEGKVEAETALTKAARWARESYGHMKASEEQRDKATQRLTDAKDRVQKLRNDRGDTVADIRDAERAYGLANKELDRMEAEVEKLQGEVNPYAAIQDQQARDRDVLSRQLAEVTGRCAYAADRATRLGFWVRGFKDVRLRLIAEALDELAIEVNSCVTSLGLVGWELVFEVDRETKTGSISRGFTVFVRSPHNDHPVPWAAWSGGEAQRLRVAAQMGLANLIRSSTGANIGLEVWDEPSDGMSPRGVADLMETLSQRAIDEQRVVFVVDHTAPGYGGFEGTYTVIKDKNGSRIEQ